MNTVTVSTLKKIKQAGEKFTCLTAYDASFARRLDEAGVDTLLVGDSLGMVIQGQDSTLPVTLEEMIYHSASVRRGSRRALVIVDMPFMSCATPEQALNNAGRLMKEGGAHVVKLEGGAVMVETVRRLAAQGIPVCAHLGLLPQSVHKVGGYKVQGREQDAAKTIQADALAMQEAGADMLVLECVPRVLAAAITQSLEIPVIGIGAGPDTDAQVLVLYDMLGITPGKAPSFVSNFLEKYGSLDAAIKGYIDEVKSGRFPAQEQCFS